MAYAKKVEVPISEKLILSAQEASAYSGIGIHRLEAMLREPDCPFVIKKGNRVYVKRELLKNYLHSEAVKEI